jgi:hypothetical protein
MKKRQKPAKAKARKRRMKKPAARPHGHVHGREAIRDYWTKQRRATR